jgi:hypothetical protein
MLPAASPSLLSKKFSLESNGSNFLGQALEAATGGARQSGMEIMNRLEEAIYRTSAISDMVTKSYLTVIDGESPHLERVAVGVVILETEAHAELEAAFKAVGSYVADLKKMGGTK